MFIVGILSWWYTAGWRRRIVLVGERILSVMDYFSVDLLIKTLFNPYRQISAGKVSGSVGKRWQAFIDQLISRIIGSIIRIVLVVIGSVTIVLLAILGGIEIFLWAVIPLLPLVGFTVALIGWTPTWI